MNELETDPKGSEPQGETTTASSEFENQATAKKRGLLAEFFAYFRDEGKWWLSPIILVLLIFGVLLALGASGAAPFIYTLF